MKIAFLILCHKSLDQVNILLSSLKDDDVYCFIHIDKKAKNIVNKIKSSSHVRVLPQERSYDVKWGGMSMINATIELMKFALEFEVDFDYIWLISGQDLPIISIDEIKKRIALFPNANYIEIIKHDDCRYRRYLKLREIYYSPWMSKNNLFVKVLKNLYMLITGGRSKTFKFLIRKKPICGDFEFGSQWWALTRETSKYILDYCYNNPNYLKYFERTLIPDECFFQTIIGNSIYRNSIRHSLTFVNWRGDRRSPSVLTKDDFDLIAECKNSYCFARKFDTNVDQTIISLICDSLITDE